MGNKFLKYFVPVIPSQSISQLSWYAAAVAILLPVAVGIISSVYPALRAAGLNPVEALKNE